LSADYDVRAARDDVRDIRGQERPTVTLQGTYQDQQTISPVRERELVESATVQVHIPLYAGGALSSQVRAAQQTVQVKERELAEAEQQARFLARSNVSQLRSTTFAVTASSAQIEADKISLTGVKKQAQGGERTELDVLVAAQALHQAQINLAHAQHDQLVAGYTLLSAVGDLTPEALRLSVTPYDATKHYEEVAHRLF
jgi:outer membrane protein